MEVCISPNSTSWQHYLQWPLLFKRLKILLQQKDLAVGYATGLIILTLSNYAQRTATSLCS